MPFHCPLATLHTHRRSDAPGCDDKPIVRIPEESGMSFGPMNVEHFARHPVREASRLLLRQPLRRAFQKSVRWTNATRVGAPPANPARATKPKAAAAMPLDYSRSGVTSDRF